LSGFFIQAIILLAVVHALAGRTRASVYWILVGLAVAGSTSIETIPSWLIIGATTGIVLMLAYLVAFRHQPMLLVFTTATVIILSTLRDGIQHPYPSALAGSIAAALLVPIAAWVWFRESARVME